MQKEELKTPFYLVKEKDLLYDISLLKDSLSQNWGNFIAGYSVKTNSLPWLLTYLKEQGFFAEVVSKTEYELAVKLVKNILFITAPSRIERFLKPFFLQEAISIWIQTMSWTGWKSSAPSIPTGALRWDCG